MPRYARRVEALLERALEEGTVRAGTVVKLEVFHDASCEAMADKGPCSCTPCMGSIREVGPGPFDDVAVVQLAHLVKGT